MKTKLDELLAKINNNHPDIRAAFGAIRITPQYRDSFENAANMLSEVVAKTFPTVQLKDRRRVASINKQSRPGNRASGRGRGSSSSRSSAGRSVGSSRNNNPPINIAPVDTTNPNRYFQNEEWSRLTWEQKQDLFKRRTPRPGKNSNDSKRNVSAVTTDTTPNNVSTITYTETQSRQRNNTVPKQQGAGASFGRESCNKRHRPNE